MALVQGQPAGTRSGSHGETHGETHGDQISGRNLKELHIFSDPLKRFQTSPTVAQTIRASAQVPKVASTMARFWPWSARSLAGYFREWDRLGQYEVNEMCELGPVGKSSVSYRSPQDNTTAVKGLVARAATISQRIVGVNVRSHTSIYPPNKTPELGIFREKHHRL